MFSKRICLFLFVIILAFGTIPPVQAQDVIQEEYTRRTGEVLSYPNRDVRFESADSEIAEVFLAKNGEQRVRFRKAGDTVVKALFATTDGGYLEYRLIFHIIGDDMSKAAPVSEVEYFAQDVLDLVNEQREKRGLIPLKQAEDLNQDAAVRAREAAEYYSHTRPDGRPFETVASRSYKFLGENLQRGAATPVQAVIALMNSPKHRENILNPDYRELGTAYYFDEKTRRACWAQLFRR